MVHGILVMYGVKGNNEPYYALFARAVLGDITFEYKRRWDQKMESMLAI
jgi:hypothetical protein